MSYNWNGFISFGGSTRQICFFLDLLHSSENELFVFVVFAYIINSTFLKHEIALTTQFISEMLLKLNIQQEMESFEEICKYRVKN